MSSLEAPYYYPGNLARPPPSHFPMAAILAISVGGLVALVILVLVIWYKFFKVEEVGGEQDADAPLADEAALPGVEPEVISEGSSVPEIDLEDVPPIAPFSLDH